jgi:uncharacterized protein (TIGR02284 family)
MAHLLLEHSPVFPSLGVSQPRARDRPKDKEKRMSHKYTIEALRELISVHRDSEQAFGLCASSPGADRLRDLCVRGGAECAAAIGELEALVASLGGGGRHAQGAVCGFWRSGWAGLRAALARGEDEAILDACERGESWILEAYRNALDDHLPDFVRDAVLRQFEALMSTHDAIRGCRLGRAARGDAGAAPGAQAGQP